MSTLNQDRRKKIFYRFYFVAAIFLLFFFGWGLIKELVNRRQINSQITDYEAKIAKLQQENSGIRNKLSSWEESADLEITARTKLGLQKPGEKAIFINRERGAQDEPLLVTKTNQEVIDLSNNKENKEKIANPIRWWKRFF